MGRMHGVCSKCGLLRVCGAKTAGLHARLQPRCAALGRAPGQRL